MTASEFSKATVAVLAKRARYQCSNPDCGIQTVGPNSDDSKSTTIGEAAHISGGKQGTARYDASLSDTSRSSVTNGIWLCRNCHVQIDRDEVLYPTELLFAWRKEHEDRVMRELGTRGENMRHDIEMRGLEFLFDYPAVIQRIVIDKPDGWEWRLAAELLRHLTKPEFKRLKSLQNGEYYQVMPSVHSDEFRSWIVDRTHTMSNLIGPLSNLLDRLTASWGEPGEPADIEEMHDTCVLFRDALSNAIDHEELLRFPRIPEEGEELRDTLLNAVGRNIEKLAEIPDKLDEIVGMIGTDHSGTTEDPLVVKWTVTFDLPPDFQQNFNDALRRYERWLLS